MLREIYLNEETNMLAGASNTLEFGKNEIRDLPLSQISPDKYQIRKEFRDEVIAALAESIEKEGQQQPIHVTDGNNGKYKIIDGECRYRAIGRIAKECDQSPEETTIRAIYIEKPQKELGIIDNLLRTTYNPMEEAEALEQLKKLLGKKATDADLAKRIGKSRSLVTEKLSLLKLPDEIKSKAKHDSCVPFRRLKALAAKKDDASAKILTYEELHKEYKLKQSQSDATHKKQKEGTTEKVPMPTRSIISATKKMEYITNKVLEIDIKKDIDKEAKAQFIKTIKNAIDAAQSILNKLEENI
ncbi:hypothetical protein C4J81_01780 [Deltaproteobacteria bacterium Smac51]|nr:hypothetical protein C4J81_01780 [Deltaproteobacteria bacterium Smac51]